MRKLLFAALIALLFLAPLVFAEEPASQPSTQDPDLKRLPELLRWNADYIKTFDLLNQKPETKIYSDAVKAVDYLFGDGKISNKLVNALIEQMPKPSSNDFRKTLFQQSVGGLLVSALINKSKSTEFVLGNRAELFDYVGYTLPAGKTLTFSGNAGNGVGSTMDGGEILVSGSAGVHTGSDMKQGEIRVEDGTNGYAGLHMSGGLITILGSAADNLGWGMKGGKIVLHGDAKNVANSMKGGTMELGVRVTGEIGDSMTAGKVTVYGPAKLSSKLGRGQTAGEEIEIYLDSFSAKEADTLIEKALLEANQAQNSGGQFGWYNAKGSIKIYAGTTATLVYPLAKHKADRVEATTKEAAKKALERPAAGKKELKLSAGPTEKAGEIKLEWNAFTGASYYSVELTPARGDTIKRKVSHGSEENLELTIGSLDTAQYVCQVSAYDSKDSRLAVSNIVMVLPAVTDTIASFTITAEPTGNIGEVRVSWEHVNGAEYYMAYANEDDPSKGPVAMSNGINDSGQGSFSYTFSGLPEKTLVFSVVARKDFDDVAFSNEVKLQAWEMGHPAELRVLEGLVVESGTGVRLENITLTLESKENLDISLIELSDVYGMFSFEVPYGEYEVTAFDGSDEHDLQKKTVYFNELWSEDRVLRFELDKVGAEPSGPGSFTISAEPTENIGEVKVSWGHVDGAEYYMAYANDEDPSKDVVAMSGGIPDTGQGSFSHTFTGLPAETLVFSVVARKGLGEEVATSNKVRLAVEAGGQPALTINGKATGKSGEIKVVWNFVEGTSYYTVDCRIPGQATFASHEEEQKEQNFFEHTMTGLRDNILYHCQALAYNEKNDVIAESNVIKIRPNDSGPPAQPLTVWYCDDDKGEIDADVQTFEFGSDLTVNICYKFNENYADRPVILEFLLDGTLKLAEYNEPLTHSPHIGGEAGFARFSISKVEAKEFERWKFFGHDAFAAGEHFIQIKGVFEGTVTEPKEFQAKPEGSFLIVKPGPPIEGNMLKVLGEIDKKMVEQLFPENK